MRKEKGFRRGKWSLAGPSDGFEEVAEVGHVGFDGGDLGGVG